MTTLEFVVYGAFIAAGSYVIAAFLCDLLVRWVNRRHDAKVLRTAVACVTALKGKA